jgi:hypothetical protein
VEEETIMSSNIENTATRPWTKALDGLGISASFLCAIHCALLPIVAGLLPVVGLQAFAHPAIEKSIFVSAFIIASLSLFPSYIRIHRKSSAIMIFIAGFTMLFIGHEAGHEWGLTWVEAPLAVAGGLGVALAHYVNYKECHECPTCQDHEHEHEEEHQH